MNLHSGEMEIVGLNSSHHFFVNGTTVEVFNVASFTIFISTLCVVALNSYVMWLIGKGRGNGPVGEFFILNLCVCEILYCVESLLAFLSYQSISANSLWVAVYFLDGLTATSRPLFHCLICLERYLAVVHPVIFLKYKLLRYKVICSVFVWMTGFVICGINGTIVILLVSLFYFVILCVQYFVFLFPQLFCCLAVLRALKQSGPGDREKEEENHMKRRAFYIILISNVSMITIYAPYVILLVVYILLPQKLEILTTISFVCFALAGLVQPLLFLYRVRKLPFVKC